MLEWYRKGTVRVVRRGEGAGEGFQVFVALHQGSTLSPFLFSIVMERLTDWVRQESSGTVVFVDDIMTCTAASKEWVEAKLGR